jgi:hypothetical protein
MSWYEIEQPGADLDFLVGDAGFVAENRREARRVFRVSGYSPNVFLHRGAQGPPSILNDNGVGMPDYGTQHPIRGDMFLSKYNTTSEDVLVFLAVAEYSKYIIERSGGFQNETYDLPIAIRKKKKVPGYQGTADQNIIGWEFSTQAVIEAHERMVVKVRLAAGEWGSVLAQIRSQQNKLHKIHGAWFRFEMPDYVQIGDMMECTYSFFGDSGILVARTGLDPGGGPRLMFVPGMTQEDSEMFPGVLWVRPPFNAIGMFPSDSTLPDEEPPDPIVFNVRGLEISGTDNDGQGWRDLPGIPQDL